MFFNEQHQTGATLCVLSVQQECLGTWVGSGLKPSEHSEPVNPAKLKSLVKQVNIANQTSSSSSLLPQVLRQCVKSPLTKG